MTAALLKQYRQSLNGRLRLAVFGECTGSQRRMPSLARQLEYVRMLALTNVIAAGAAQAVLFKTARLLEASAPVDEGEVSGLLAALERAPPGRTLVFECRDCEPPLPPSVVVVTTAHELVEGGLVHSFIVIDEKFPRLVVGGLRVRTSSKAPDPVLKILSTDGWTSHDLPVLMRHPLGRLALQVLRKCLTIQGTGEVRTLRWAELRQFAIVEEGLEPPEDPRFTELYVEAMAGTLPACHARVSMHRVRPWAPHYCARMLEDPPSGVLGSVRAGMEMPLVVYWDGSSFVMSDDYSVYCSLKILKRRSAPAVILGSFPPDMASDVRPIAALSDEPLFGVEEAPSPALLEWKLGKGHALPPLSEELAVQHATFMAFAELIQSGAKEREIHQFIREYPSVIDAYCAGVASELRLGSRYQVDLVFRSSVSPEKVTLVELERASHEVFTRAGRLRKEVEHARQQVEDWFRWWREHPADVPTGYSPSAPLEGYVVIGRSRGWTPDLQARLDHLNEGLRVKVFTYDHILQRYSIAITALHGQGVAEA